MSVSFIIITNNHKKEELNLQIKSIRNLNIPTYEIVLCGVIDDKYKNNNDIKWIEDTYNAERGSLGGMRNNACKIALYDNLVISDDDMLFTEDWYDNFKNIDNNFDIITPRVKLPDNTRFWDHACYMSPEKGHVMLNSQENDNYLYMSGGQSWIIKKECWEKIKWNEDLLIYKMSSLEDYNKGMHNEDTDFALRCRKNNFKIIHKPEIRVYHNDATYTSIGRIVKRRSESKKSNWCKTLRFPDEINIQIAISLANFGFEAEAIDILRMLISKNNFLAEQVYFSIENKNGDKLEDSNYLDYNKKYENLIIKLK